MILRILLICALAAWGVLAQEPHQPEHKQPEAAQAEPAHAEPAHGGAVAEGAHGADASHDSGDPMIWWKWVNFALLAGVLGFLASKNLPAFFKERDDEIQRELAEARQLKSEADSRAKEVEQRMARMEAEIESLRSSAKQELASEGERIAKETEDAMAKVRAHAEYEITSIAKAAKLDLKNQAAKLALDLAEERIRGKAQSVDASLVSGFIRDLGGVLGGSRKGAQN